MKSINFIQKTSAFFLLNAIILNFSYFPASANFDPITFHKTAYENFKDAENKPTALYLISHQKIKDKIIQAANDIRNDKFTLPNSNDNKKITAFIKTFPTDTWSDHPFFSQIVISTLLQNVIPRESQRLTLDDTDKYFKIVKNAMCELINKDPSFSCNFKTYITNKIQDLKLYIPGISQPITNIHEMSLDEITLDKNGNLENLDSWEQNRASNHAHLEELKYEGEIDQPSISSLGSKKNFDDLLFEEIGNYSDIYDLCSSNAKMLDSTNIIWINPGNLIDPYSTDITSVNAKFLFTLGHEITHFILGLFKENYTSRYGTTIYGALPPGDIVTCKNLYNEFNIPNDGINFDLDFIRAIAYEQAAQISESEEQKAALSIPSKEDREYITKIYKMIVNYINNINTNLIYPDEELFEEHALVGLPVKLSGDGYFSESIADIIGFKAALIAASQLNISSEQIYKYGSECIWEPTNIDQALGGMCAGVYAMSPYRVEIAYHFSSISPNMFGFSPDTP